MSKFIKFLNDVYVDLDEIAYFEIIGDWSGKTIAGSYRVSLYLRNNPNVMSPILVKGQLDKFCKMMGVEYLD